MDGSEKERFAMACRFPIADSEWMIWAEWRIFLPIERYVYRGQRGNQNLSGFLTALMANFELLRRQRASMVHR
jgi:hypothetical protein